MQIKLTNNQSYYKTTCNYYQEGAYPPEFECDKGFVGFFAEPDSNIFKKYVDLIIKYNSENWFSRDGWELVIKRFDSKEEANIYSECEHLLVELDSINVSKKDRNLCECCIDQITNYKLCAGDIKNMLKQTLRYVINNEGKLKYLGERNDQPTSNYTINNNSTS